MANHPHRPLLPGSLNFVSVKTAIPINRFRGVFGERVKSRALILSVALLAIVLAIFAPRVLAQGGPRVIAVDPGSAKVNDSVSVTGEHLGKASVVAVFLSDEKSDYKATLDDQSDGKIVFKVPQVKTGSYNISLQIGGTILIQPVRISVE